MPYIAPNIRRTKLDETSFEADLDDHIESIIAIAKAAVPNDKLSGLSNYIISRIVTGVLDPKNYAQMAGVVATFECAKLEFVRRIMNPYEDEAIAKNGDIPEYQIRTPQDKYQKVSLGPRDN